VLPPDQDRDHETSRVLMEMGYLKARLEGDFQENGTASSLQNYIEALQAHASDAGILPTDDDQHSNSNQVAMGIPRSDSIGAASDPESSPDSAIEMSEDGSLSFNPTKEGSPKGKERAHSPSSSFALPSACLDHRAHLDEIDEFLDELKEMPSRAPTPPPKAPSRMSWILSRRSSVAIALSEAQTSSIADSSSAITGSSSTPSSPTRPRRSPSVVGLSPPTSLLIPEDSGFIFAPVVTKIEPVVPDRNSGSSTSDTRSLFSYRSSRGLGRIFGPVLDALSETNNHANALPERPSSSMSMRSAAPVFDLVRQKSKRLTANINRFNTATGSGTLHLAAWQRDVPGVSRTIPEEPSDTSNSGSTSPVHGVKVEAVFGVSLKKSMNLAKASATTHHGSGTNSRSRRDFPLCLMKCCTYIRQAGGIKAPHIFGQGAHPEDVALLQQMFSTGPDYGKDIDLDTFGVYAAADLLVAYLTQLPKPLVPEAVSSRWITLSRQATLPGTHAIRLEQCIDFWEEALGGMPRGAARSVFKLLLNLWGDVADAADDNCMTAERLAARVVRAVMRIPAGKVETDYMLGLAFLIRKRSEYSMIVRGEERRSNAAF
jgi:hypothetical protein